LIFGWGAIAWWWGDEWAISVLIFDWGRSLFYGEMKGRSLFVDF
jgi:hypothetical protein